MSNVPRFNIDYIARLARLHLTPKQSKKFSKQLSDILAHIKKMDEVDLSKVEPTFQTTGLTDALRDDEIEKARILTQEEALSNAPKKSRGFFKIPKIL